MIYFDQVLEDLLRPFEEHWDACMQEEETCMEQGVGVGGQRGEGEGEEGGGGGGEGSRERKLAGAGGSEEVNTRGGTLGRDGYVLSSSSRKSRRPGREGSEYERWNQVRRNES